VITEFMTFEIGLQPLPELQRSILAKLQESGEPLRWAIVAISPDRQATIEAVVIKAP
jgi:hypothetical protein